MAARVADHQKVAGIDRHAEMLDAPADGFERGGNDIAAVGNRGGAEHDGQLGAFLEHFVQRARERGTLMRHAPFGDDAGARGREPLGGDLQRLLDHLGREPRQQRRHHADLADAIGRNAHQRLLDAGQRRIARGLGDRERNDLHGRDHLAGDDGLVGLQRRERDRLVDAVERIGAVLVDDQHAGILREQIAAPRKGAIDMHALARDRLGDLGRSDVLGHIARLEPRHHDVLDAGRLKRGHLGGADQRALLEHQTVLPDAVHGGRAERLLRRDRAELHDAASGSCRSRAVISPMIETAISAGEIAPMWRPIGA